MLGEPAPLVLGHGGKLFVADMERARDVEMTVGGKRCLVHLDPLPPSAAFRGPTLLCLREASDAD